MDGPQLGGESRTTTQEESSPSLPEVSVALGLSIALSPEAGSRDVTDEASHGFPCPGCCSEAVMLEYAFQACDPEGTGKVLASKILEYLQCVTGQSPEGEELHSLYHRLDPGESGVSVDLRTFHTVMSEWIEEQRQERAYEGAKDRDGVTENAGLPRPGNGSVSGPAQLEGYGGDIPKFSLKLVTENAKLQRSVEVSEEASARVTEEIGHLRSKLRISQQALQHAKSTASELEELKTVVKTLEEENCQLQAQSRLLEKAQQCLSSQAHNLQEENEKLLAEREWTRGKLDELAAETVELQHQLSDCESLLTHKDGLLGQSMSQTEELKETLEEYQEVIQELKIEIIQLQKQLSQTCTDILPCVGMPGRNKKLIQMGAGRWRSDSMAACVNGPMFPEAASASIRIAVQSLCMEIEEIQQGRDKEAELISPLCGMLPWPSSAIATKLEDELLSLCEEMSKAGPWEGTAELVRQIRQDDRGTVVQGLNSSLVLGTHRTRWWTCSSGAGKEERLDPRQSSGAQTCEEGGGQDSSQEKVLYPACSWAEHLEPAIGKRTERSGAELALLPVRNQLVLLSRSPSDPACQLWLFLTQGTALLGVLLLLLLATTCFSLRQWGFTSGP
ncbi:protein KASH5 isoform X2 [Rhinatrema bivittatum]|uniref:protein KASH5 isoform X2 n=1 Tax=Rhinatrema bivittatum TaxID=194408 RepID=UPI00112980C0|nr:protein KASH5 isoform X2 [Rhinatrema bivittatum]